LFVFVVDLFFKQLSDQPFLVSFCRVFQIPRRKLKHALSRRPDAPLWRMDW
jgi:hypothetical protein